jgi:hypothetical protein
MIDGKIFLVTKLVKLMMTESIPSSIMNTPKLLDRFNYESKDGNNERIRSMLLSL